MYKYFLIFNACRTKQQFNCSRDTCCVNRDVRYYTVTSDAYTGFIIRMLPTMCDTAELEMEDMEEVVWSTMGARYAHLDYCAAPFYADPAVRPKKERYCLTFDQVSRSPYGSHIDLALL